MKRSITFKGKEMTCLGRIPEVGTKAPNFQTCDQDLNDRGLGAFAKKIKVITTFISLDTSVCQCQLKEFNKKAAELSDDIVVVALSRDLPFAQKRYCEAEHIENVKVLSDYKNSSFGVNYGVLIKELQLLARCVLIIDQNDVMRYIQYVEENTQEPDYQEAFGKLQDVVKNPAQTPEEKELQECKPCKGQDRALGGDQIASKMKSLTQWQCEDNQRITKEFKLKDFTEAKLLVDLIALIAQEQQHHPDLVLTYNKVKVILRTHAVKGLSQNDFIMARIIDELAS